MPSLRIALLGAGSLYYPEVLAELALATGLSGSEVCLYDLDLEKSELMAAAGVRLASEAGADLRFRVCPELPETLDGADFVLSSIGGSGASLGGVHATDAHNADRIIPTRYGIFQLTGDTGGPAGMMMGLRSIPIHLEIAREMERRCPHAVLLNHSNPMAVLCRAVRKYTSINIIGICHGVQVGMRRAAELMDLAPEELEVTWIGTNHYYWFTRIRHRGQDVYPEVMRRSAARRQPHGEIMSELLSQAYGYRLAYRSDRHEIEFYPFLAQVRQAAEMPYGFEQVARKRYANGSQLPAPPPSAADRQALRERQLKEFAHELDAWRLPEPQADGIEAEGMASLVEAIATGQRQIRILNLPNEGVVSNLPDYGILEMEAVTDSSGARGIHVGEAPLALMGLLQKRIAWQEMVVEAGVRGDRQLALQAMLLDEMAIRPEKASKLLDELLAASRDLLPQFTQTDGAAVPAGRAAAASERVARRSR